MSSLRRVLFALPLALGLPSVALAAPHPPAPPVRHELAPPRAGFRWAGGHWAWRARAWVWVPGAYVRLAVPVAPTLVIKL